MVDLRQFLQSYQIDTSRLQPEPGKVHLAKGHHVFDVGTQTGFFIGDTGRNIDTLLGYGSIPFAEYPDVETIYDRIVTLFETYITRDFTRQDWEVMPGEMGEFFGTLLDFPLASILMGQELPEDLRARLPVPCYVSPHVDPNMVFGLCAPEYVGVIVTDGLNKTGIMVHGGIARAFLPSAV